MRFSDEQMDDVSAMIMEASMAPTTPIAKKRVRFSVVEVLEFRVGYTSCAVPTVGGPPVGLIGTPISKNVYEFSQTQEDIDEEDANPRGDINDVWICPVERAELLTETYGFTQDDISLLCREARAIQDSRAVSRLDFNAAHALRSCDLAQLQIFQELQNPSNEQVETPRQKVMLFDSSPAIGVLA